MNDRVQHYSRKGQTLSPIRPSQEFPNFRACLWCPIHQTDLWSFCSTYEPTEFPSISSEGKHSPRYDRAKSFPISVRAFGVPYIKPTFGVFALPMSRPSFPLFRARANTLPDTTEPKVSRFRACLWCPHIPKRPTEFLLYLQADEVAHNSERLCNLPATNERPSSPLFRARANTLPDTTEPRVSQFPCVPLVSLYPATDLASFCSTCKPMKSIHIPKAFAISLQAMSEQVFEQPETATEFFIIR